MKLTWNAPKIEPDKAIFTWTAEHAEAVHNGETDLAGVEKPARPWTEVTVAETDMEALFVDNFDVSQMTSGENLPENIKQAFRDTAEDLGDAFKDTIVNHDWGLPSTGQKLHKDAPTWVTIDDSGELRESQSLEFEE
ncbi:hypothetical protein H6G00_05180 [Leptolyngbya sp. FACHB-541]|uniref:hypothetical protein n=1 Tax=Leptolyngbya sp. FACHB-541 TaxID=2692810 RepID=UPI001688FB53|nr:hypothetical protein [Leptolyngbya sp. FACHB-541]MBD1996009.1 hypothetical protein [Leptolyngbya sp. FACHB-541]